MVPVWRYYIRYRRGGRDSKEIEEPVGRESEGMTAAKANKIRGLRSSGTEMSNTEARSEAARQRSNVAPTVNDLWQKYREAHQTAPSMRTDDYTIELLAKVSYVEARSLTTADVDRLSRTLFNTPSSRRGKDGIKQNLSAQSVKHALGLLKRILKYADHMGICPYPSGLVFTMPKLDNQKTETMTAEQMRNYISALDQEPDQDAATFLRVALFTGMRKTAIINLTWDDLNFETNMITLQGQFAKNRRTETIPMPEVLKDALLKITRTDSKYVFPGRNGEKRSDFKRIALRVRDKAGLPPDFRPNPWPAPHICLTPGIERSWPLRPAKAYDA